MEKYDSKAHLDWLKKNKNEKGIMTFAGDDHINPILRDVDISHHLETKAYPFSDGEGRVAKKMTIEIDFSRMDYPIQPHADFEGVLCGHILDWIGDELNGDMEIALDEQISDEMAAESAEIEAERAKD